MTTLSPRSIGIGSRVYTLSLGGVDVFHGGVESPGIKTKTIPGVNSIILHNIEIKSGEPMEKIVKFQNHR